MKKSYKVFSALLALSAMLSLDLKAQFNGLYTINSAAPASATNFTTFSTFASSINAVGVSGPVTIDVVAGGAVYNEQVEFTAIAGTSSTNTITINGYSNTISFAASLLASPWTMNLNGTDFMTVNNLTITGTGGTYAMSLHLWNQANNNTFNNCRVTAPLNGTGTRQCPISLSGIANNPTSTGANVGNDNIFNGCTASGGYRGIVIYGSTSNVTTGNQVINCKVEDFYLQGIYFYYSRYATARGNIVERLNRTTLTTGYGVYVGANSYPANIEKNRIRRMADGNPLGYAAIYGIYMAGSGTSASVNVISNNLISDNNTNSDVLGLYDCCYSYNNFINNTIVMDNASSPSGWIYGMYMTGPGPNEVRNNLVSIDRTGSGDKTCIYMSNLSNNVNNNIYYQNSQSGNNYIGTFSGTGYNTLAGWKANGTDGFSAAGNPQFVNPGVYNYTPQNPLLNNVGANLGITTDINNLARNLPAPDAGAFEFFNQNCATVSGTNAVVAPTVIVCQNQLNSLQLANGYTVNGLTFTWQSATNLIGPYTAISGATMATYQTPTLSASLYYNVIIGCSFGGTSVTAVPAMVNVAVTVTNSVPYFEGFEGINNNKEMPNCSWLKSDSYQCGSRTALVGGFRAPRTGAKFAEFDASNYVYYNTRYFYTNGILMKAGVTYSAAVWFNTSGSPAWTNFEIMYGTSQSPTGLTQIAIEASPNAQNYQLLSGTYTVPATGIYYVALKATENGYGTQMVWDDLAITIPCQHTMNAAPVVVTGPSMICAGSPAVFNASGAGTYTWTGGPQTSTYSPTPMFNTTFSVTGTNTVSGCSNMVLKPVIVNQLPLVSVVVFDDAICPGESITMHATSANSYTWSQGPAFTPFITVSPLVTTSYTLLGKDAFGCVGTAIHTVVVNPNPVVAITGNTLICAGDAANLSASATGVNNFEWKASDLYLQSPFVSVMPQTTTVYTVSGVDNNGCKGTNMVVVAVEPCTGIKNISGASNRVSVYPNPSNGVFTVELNNSLNKTIEVVDVTGRVVSATQTTNATTEVNISALSNGVYYIKVKSENSTDVLKVVKH